MDNADGTIYFKEAAERANQLELDLSRFRIPRSGTLRNDLYGVPCPSSLESSHFRHEFFEPRWVRADD